MNEETKDNVENGFGELDVEFLDNVNSINSGGSPGNSPARNFSKKKKRNSAIEPYSPSPRRSN